MPEQVFQGVGRAGVILANTALCYFFLPVDHSGTAWELDDAMAAQCGYAVTYTTWRNIEFRASALSCHSHLEVSLLQTF